MRPKLHHANMYEVEQIAKHEDGNGNSVMVEAIKESLASDPSSDNEDAQASAVA